MELAPVTVYPVFIAGLTIIVEDVAPVFHRQVVAPLAVNVVFPPEQMVNVPLIATVGVVDTATV